MRSQQNVVLTSLLIFLYSPLTAADAPSFIEKGKKEKAKATTLVDMSGVNIDPIEIVGPRGKIGDSGPKGHTGTKGPPGPGKERSAPHYASVFVSGATPKEQREFDGAEGTKITVPFDQMGLHSDEFCLDPCCHMLSLPPGVYSLSFQFMLRGAFQQNTLIKIPKLFLTLHGTCGPPCIIPIDAVCGDMGSSYSEQSFAYIGKTVFTVPNDKNYSISLDVIKGDSHVWFFEDINLTYREPFEPGYNNPAQMTVVKIADYQP